MTTRVPEKPRTNLFLNKLIPEKKGAPLKTSRQNPNIKSLNGQNMGKIVYSCVTYKIPLWSKNSRFFMVSYRC